MSADISGPARHHGPVVPPRPAPLPGRPAVWEEPQAAAALPPARAEVPEGAPPAAWPVGEEEGPLITRSLLARTTDLINEILEGTRRRLKFNVHEETGRIWVQVIDTRTREVIKEIPPERYLDLVARIWQLVGILVDEKA